MKTFENSQWIWYQAADVDLVNSWAQARRVFTIDDVPSTAEIALTADAQYRLWVNGTYVCRGPARGFQDHWPFDRVDIAPYLRKGKNVIAVLAHNPGMGTFQYIHRFWAGFILDGVVGDVNLATDAEWRIREAPEYFRGVWRLSAQMGVQEFFDCRKEEPWLEADYEDSRWLSPGNRGAYPPYREPWPDFEERQIPLLREGIVNPEKIVCVADGKADPDFRSPQNIATLYVNEQRRWQTEAIQLGGKAFSVAPVSEGAFRSYLVDFGYEVVGSPILSVDGALGGEIIDYIGCEAYDEETSAPIIKSPEKHGDKVGMASRLFAKKDQTEHELFTYWGMRYLVVTVRDAPAGIKVRISLREVSYPLSGFDNFCSSDLKLNKIYEICGRTVKCCCFDAIVDGPWREQAQWGGDASFIGQCVFYLNADHKLYSRSVRQMGQQALPNGLTMAVAPSVGWNLVLPNYTLMWIHSMYEIYWQTGDISLFRDQKEGVIRALAYYEKQSESNGLLPNDARYWLYMDSFPFHLDGYPTLYSLLYLWALKAAVELFELDNDLDSSVHYREIANRLDRSIRKEMVTPEAGEFHAGLTWDCRPVDGDIPHAYAMAVLAGFMPERHDLFIAEILKYVARDPRKENMGRPFFLYYFYEALKQNGYYKETLESIARLWGEEFVDRGLTTVTEGWSPLKPDGGGSLCHGWSSHPIKHFANILMGVRQTAAGWKAVQYSPLFESVQSVSGKVPTSLGTIESAWEVKNGRIEARLKAPAGMIVEITIKGHDEMLAGPFEKTFSIERFLP